ncbi:MAG: AIPR family protein [Xylophilus sp.]|nr:AIPR family protein [Xylophilus sp.]
MSQLSKTVIHNQVYRLSEQHYGLSGASSTDERRRALSKAFALLCAMQWLDLDEDEALDAVVDGSNDRGIDAIWVAEPQGGFFDVHLFQTKYSEDLDRDKGFSENEVIKIINTLRGLLRQKNFQVNNALDIHLAEVRSHLDEFNLPNFFVYLCNNGQGFSPNAQAHIDAFLSESPENSKRYKFRYINHVDIFRASEKTEPVNCALDFAGGFVDEAINFKRAFVGKVQVAQIADLLNQFDDRLLGRNVRDFLGFRRVVNEGIRATLQDADKCKDFYFLNNGITFVCDKLSYAQGASGARARLSNAQIINGGQTSRTIQNVVNDAPERDFSQAYVLVRAYEVDMDDQGDLIQDIITATNSQNAIFARDLHANDAVQRTLEAGLKAYGMRYLRRRDSARAKPDDIRMELAAECLVTVLLHKPVDAKYRKTLHFMPEFYPEIFNVAQVTPEMVLLATGLFKRIETERKHADSSRLQQYPFIPLASHFLLWWIYQAVTANKRPDRAAWSALSTQLAPGNFGGYYQDALDALSNQLTTSLRDEQRDDALALAQLLRSDGFVKSWTRAARLL